MKKSYLVVYEAGDQNLSGFAPDIPGCVSTGHDLTEMRRAMRESLEFHLKGLAADEDSIPEPLTSGVDFSLDRPENGIDHCVVEWLEIEVPEFQYQVAS